MTTSTSIHNIKEISSTVKTHLSADGSIFMKIMNIIATDENGGKYEFSLFMSDENAPAVIMQQETETYRMRGEA